MSSKSSDLIFTYGNSTKPLSVYDANKDQDEILCFLFKKLKEFILFKSKNRTDNFEPVRLTICGAAGSGKSHLINIIVNTFRTIFSRNDVVHIAAPTGCAANNVNGQTVHRLFKINCKNPYQDLSATGKEFMTSMFKHTLAIIIDEQSMVTCEQLGAAERNVSCTAHGGKHDNENWGGIPFIIMVGDDYQLPPPSKKEIGPFDIMNRRARERTSKFSVRTNGITQYLKMAQTVMTLKIIERQRESQRVFRNVLTRFRNNTQTVTDAAKLLKLDLLNFSTQEEETLKEGAMWIFANKQPRDEHNIRSLVHDMSAENPVAVIRATITTEGRNRRTNLAHFTDDRLQQQTMMCRNALVSINGSNFAPEWGLYNGAIGVVRDIVYEPGKDPNNNDLPSYVAVEIKSYRGPPWINDNPHIVPVPITQVRCDKKCCVMTFCPLQLSYGRTIHTFQGMNAGPVEDGQPPNQIKRIIVDPGDQAMEGRNPGLLYTVLSRATTMGDDSGRGSAIYFKGPNIEPGRFVNCGYTTTGTEYAAVTNRKQWVEYLNQHTVTSTTSQRQKQALYKWISNIKVTHAELQDILSDNSWRSSRDGGVNW